MIENAHYVDGKVAMRYHQPVPKQIKIGNKVFVFTMGHGISLSLVDEEDVPSLLAYLGGCCGGKKKVISLASEAVYLHWLEGNGGR